MNSTTKCVNGTLQVGDKVLSTPEDEYAYLVGEVIRIIPLGSPEHDTTNKCDEVYVNFESNYSRNRIREIEDMFSVLFQAEKSYEELPLDQTIMNPDYLIRITGIDDKQLQSILNCESNAALYCYSELRRLMREVSAKENK